MEFVVYKELGNISCSLIPEPRASISGFGAFRVPSDASSRPFCPSAPSSLRGAGGLKTFPFQNSCAWQRVLSDLWIICMKKWLNVHFWRLEICFQWTCGMNPRLPAFSRVFLSPVERCLQRSLSIFCLRSFLRELFAWGFGAKPPVPYAHISRIILHGKYNSSEIWFCFVGVFEVWFRVPYMTNVVFKMFSVRIGVELRFHFGKYGKSLYFCFKPLTI